MLNLPHSCVLPKGYRWGAHYEGSVWYLLRGDESVLCNNREDLYEVRRATENDTHGMTRREIREAIEEAFVSARGQNHT